MSSQNYLNQPGDLMKVPGTIGDGSRDPQREGWDYATSDPEDFPLGKACNPMGDEPCSACE